MKSAKSPFLHPRSTFFRLISSFFILLLPFLILGLLFLSWSRAHMKTEIEASAQASVQYMTQNFKEKVDDLNSLLYQMTFGSSITEFAYNQDNLSTSDYYISLWEQYSLLREYQSIYPLIEDMFLCFCSFISIFLFYVYSYYINYTRKMRLSELPCFFYNHDIISSVLLPSYPIIPFLVSFTAFAPSFYIYNGNDSK